MSRVMLSGSIEYLEAEVEADVDLTSQPVDFSIDRGATWLSGQWDGPSILVDRVVGGVKKRFFSRVARVLLGDSNPMPAVGEYPVWVRVSDAPEVLELPAGALVVEP